MKKQRRKRYIQFSTLGFELNKFILFKEKAKISGAGMHERDGKMKNARILLFEKHFGGK